MLRFSLLLECCFYGHTMYDVEFTEPCHEKYHFFAIENVLICVSAVCNLSIAIVGSWQCLLRRKML